MRELLQLESLKSGEKPDLIKKEAYLKALDAAKELAQTNGEPENAYFSIEQASMLEVLDQHEEAEAAYQKAHEQARSLMARRDALRKFLAFYLRTGQEEKAPELLKLAEADNLPPEEFLLLLAEMADYESGGLDQDATFELTEQIWELSGTLHPGARVLQAQAKAKRAEARVLWASEEDRARTFSEESENLMRLSRQAERRGEL
jgi:tetratricopeptide (TPR) repeat protein